MNLLFLHIGFGEYFITGAESEQGHPENMYLTGKESWRQRCQELYSNSVTSLNHENPYNFLSCEVQEETLFSLVWLAQGRGTVTPRNYYYITASKAGRAAKEEIFALCSCFPPLSPF